MFGDGLAVEEDFAIAEDAVEIAKYDEAGKLVANPRVTVQHNGVTIHKDRELPGERNTTAAPTKAGPGAGPIYLQNHGNPVRYRNIWVVETK